MPEPLAPHEVDALLRPDLRTVAADLFELSTNLDRMHHALASLEGALTALDAARRRAHAALADAERARPSRAPRGD